MTIAEREAKLRREFPRMFDHPGALPGEVWLGDHEISVVDMTASQYRTVAGLKTARVGEEPAKVLLELKSGAIGVPKQEEFEGRSLFASLQEYLVGLERWERESPE